MGAPENNIFSPLIPKERQVDAETWQFRPLAARPAAGSVPSPAQERRDLRREFERGLEQGRREAIAAAAAQRQSQAQSIAGVLADLRARFGELESAGADALLDLALEIARQVVRREIQIHRDAVLPALREAVAMVIDQQAHPRVHMNPRDLEAIRADLDADGLFKGCRFIPDAQVGAGSCRVETALGEIDARLEVRWRRVVAEALGVDQPWSEEPPAGDGPP